MQLRNELTRGSSLVVFVIPSTSVTSNGPMATKEARGQRFVFREAILGKPRGRSCFKLTHQTATWGWIEGPPAKPSTGTYLGRHHLHHRLAYRSVCLGIVGANTRITEHEENTLTRQLGQVQLDADKTTAAYLLNLDIKYPRATKDGMSVTWY